MNLLSKIITNLSREEKLDFIQYLKKKNRRGDVKNIQFFKLIAAGVSTNLDVKIYGKPAKNTYHALSKRLYDSLIDFIASKSFDGETSEELEILKLLLASRIFFESGEPKIGYKTLAKAEKKAKQLDLYSILNEIYHTKIQYAHFNDTLVLKEVLLAANNNMELFNKEYKLNMVYAMINEEMKKANNKPIGAIVKDAFLNFDININNTLTYKSLYQIMSVTSDVAKEQSNYYAIAPFMEDAYTVLRSKHGIEHKHLFYHIEILDLLAMNSFRNKQFVASMGFAKEMEQVMLKSDEKYYNRFLEQLVILKALNYNFTGDYTKALELLLSEQSNSLDIKLITVMCLFQQNKYTKAYEIYKELRHSDNWYIKKKGRIWLLKKNILEILLLIELDKLDLVLLRLHSFKRKYALLLKELEEERALTFVKLIEYYYDNPSNVTSLAFKEKVERSFNWVGAEQEDIFVMSFYAWLKAKMEQKNLYETTLHLVQQ